MRQGSGKARSAIGMLAGHTGRLGRLVPGGEVPRSRPTDPTAGALRAPRRQNWLPEFYQPRNWMTSNECRELAEAE